MKIVKIKSEEAKLLRITMYKLEKKNKNEIKIE